MRIDIIAVAVEDRGKYKMAEVTYKSDGKTSAKKIMSFGAAAEVFKVLSNAQPGQTFDVTSQKNDKGYWDWVSISQGGVAQASSNSGGSSSVANPAPRSNYETPEERAQRQVLIVRQSSLSSAIEHLKANTKKVPTIEEVISVARQFEDYVFGRVVNQAAGIPELTDDLPY